MAIDITAATAATTHPKAVERYAPTISALQGQAWTAWNESYHVEDRHTYQSLGRELYAQDMHERIETLFARSDEQNAMLDSLLERAA